MVIPVMLIGWILIGTALFFRSIKAYRACGCYDPSIRKDLLINCYVFWPVLVYRLLKNMRGDSDISRR